MTKTLWVLGGLNLLWIVYLNWRMQRKVGKNIVSELRNDLREAKIRTPFLVALLATSLLITWGAISSVLDYWSPGAWFYLALVLLIDLGFLRAIVRRHSRRAGA
ncbi:MAG: hypothetical protein ABIS18_06960 [Actinomycetota bacterium]